MHNIEEYFALREFAPGTRALNMRKIMSIVFGFECLETESIAQLMRRNIGVEEVSAPVKTDLAEAGESFFFLFSFFLFFFFFLFVFF